MFDGMSPEGIWTVIALWAVMAGLVAWMATNRGRSGLAWFLVSVLLSPLIAFFALVLMPNQKKAEPAPASGACPRCQTPRVSGQRVCAGCGLDLWADYDARAAK